MSKKDKKNKVGRKKEAAPNSRRDFLKKAGTVGAGTFVGAAALLTGSDEAEAGGTWAEWFQRNYRLMTDE